MPKEIPGRDEVGNEVVLLSVADWLRSEMVHTTGSRTGTYHIIGPDNSGPGKG
jgi:hypothetical protein